MSDYYENFTNEQLHHALAKAVAERDEALEENLEQANLLGMGGEREDRLIAERDELLKKLQRLANILKQADEEYGPCIGGKADMLANAIEEVTK